MIKGQQGVERGRQLPLAGEGEELAVQPGGGLLRDLTIGHDDHVQGRVGDVPKNGRRRALMVVMMTHALFTMIMTLCYS